MFKRLLFRYLFNIEFGCVKITDQKETKAFGDAASEQAVTIQVFNHSAYKMMVLGGSIGAAESYMSGHWECDDLTLLFEIFLDNYRHLEKIDGKFSHVKRLLNRLINVSKNNTKKQSKRNISDHYDLSNDFYQLFLDETMMYSSAYFKSPGLSLHQASLAKLERICQKLSLKSTDHLLEIGSGWGGLLIYAAKKIGCQVTTTTISTQQYEYCCDLIKREGLTGQVTVLFQDYRELRGQYDKLVSIEMIEAVGDKYLPAYFKQCCHLLKPDGLFLLQAITIVDQLYDEFKSEVDFIKKYIFPGSCVPSLNRILQVTQRNTSFQLMDAFSIGHDYAKTLRCWLNNVDCQVSSIKKLGFDERFIRMWRYYLTYCEAGFIKAHINDFQILFKKMAHL